MKHIVDFQDCRWFELETIEEARADHAQTGDKGAFPFWRHTEQGNTFHILRDGQDRTLMTTMVFKGGALVESKVNAGDAPDFHHDAVQALMAELRVHGRSFIWGETLGEQRQKALDEKFAHEDAQASDDAADDPVPLKR